MTTDSLHSLSTPASHSDLCLDVPTTGDQVPTLPSINPIDRSMIDEVELTSPHRAETIVRRARDAHRAWQRRPLETRIQRVHKYLDHLLENRDHLLERLCQETGKSDLEARRELWHTLEDVGHQLQHAHDVLCAQAHGGRPLGLRPRTARRPRGIVLVAPGAYAPLYTTIAPSVATLLSGNAVVIVGHRNAPLTPERCADLAHQAGFADDLWQSVCGGRRLVDALADRSDAVVSYRDAMHTRRLARRQGERMIPVMGRWPTGDILLVLADADLPAAAQAATRAACAGAGRRLRSLRRTYVQRAVHDAFVDHVVEAVGALRAAQPTSSEAPPLPGVGPLPDRDALNAIQDLVDDATDAGARLVAGGHPHHDHQGFFYHPTVLTQVDESMRLWREHAPGPILAIAPTQAPIDAIQQSRQAPRAGALSIFTRQPDVAHQLAELAPTPAVGINHIPHFLPPQTPPGPATADACPDPLGAHRLRALTQQSLVVERRPASLPSWLSEQPPKRRRQALDAALSIQAKKRRLGRRLNDLWPL